MIGFDGRVIFLTQRPDRPTFTSGRPSRDATLLPLWKPILRPGRIGGDGMQRFAIAAVAAIFALAPLESAAQERAGDAALGAVSGAVVLGPVGALAGAVVGYTAGPSIARAWGLKRPRQQARRPAPRSKQAAARPSGPSSTGTASSPPSPRNKMPPVQALE